MKIICLVGITILLHLGALGGTTATGEWSVRIRGGSTPFEGRVEVLLGREWGVIRDNHWDIDDASVVCRQLGFPNVKSATLGGQFNPASPTVPIHISGLQCTGRERSLSECSYSSVNRQRVRQHTRNAGVICAGDQSVRLINGSSHESGILQILLDGTEWSIVCHTSVSWTQEDAMVACKELGYPQPISNQGVSLPGDNPVLTLALNCMGSEFNLKSCADYSIISRNCSTNMIVSLQCGGAPSTPHRPRVNNLNCSSVIVTWDASYYNGSPIALYSLRFRLIENIITDSEFVPWEEFNTTDASVAITSLMPGSIYLIGIRAINDFGSSAFSESVTVVTRLPEIFSPSDLRAFDIGSKSVNVSWTVPPACATEITSYELQYFSLDNPDARLVNIIPVITPSLVGTETVTVDHTLHHLVPYSGYSMRVRIHGYRQNSGYNESVDGNEGTQLVISNYSNSITLRTMQDAPSGSPTSFTAFLRSSAHFQWGPVPENQSNGIITYYFLSCRVNGVQWDNTSWNISNSTFEYQVDTLERDSQYECNIAAGTNVEKGPKSAAIFFTTPADLNIAPSPPRNVAFAILPNTDNTRHEVLLQARWAVQDCRNYNCVRVHGYVITCTTTTNSADHIRAIIWQYELEHVPEGEIASVNLSAKPFTDYNCYMSSLNNYGVSNPGTRIRISTPERAPNQSPSQLFAANIESDRATLRWYYNETPPTGTLSDFNISVYERDLDTVDSGTHKHSIRYNEFNPSITKFSYILEGLTPSVDYIITISAGTNGGEGPEGRLLFRTGRSEPNRPTNLLYTIESTIEPFEFEFSWSLEQGTPSQTNESMVHSGFILACTANTTVSNFEAYDRNILNHSYMISSVQNQYSVRVYMPVNCDVDIKFYLCGVSAFNERGRGPSSERIQTYLPCNSGGALSGSALSNPYFSITFVTLFLFLLIFVAVYTIILCICIRNNKESYHGYDEEDKCYATVNELYDESYIKMAPSDSSVKSSSIMKRPFSRRMMPPIPPSRTHSSIEGTYINNDYDEIPGGGSNQHPHQHQNQHKPPQEHILYAEINSNGSTAASTTDSLERNTTSWNDTYGVHISRRTSSKKSNPPNGNHQDLPSTTTTTNPKLQLTETCSTDMNDTDFLRPSASNDTSLSGGNDYVEVTAGKERPVSKRLRSNSNSPRRSAAHYNQFPLGMQVKYNPYDNIPGALVGGSGTPHHQHGETRLPSGASGGCHSEFVEVTDRMIGKRNSLESNDPPYVAMSDLGTTDSG